MEQYLTPMGPTKLHVNPIFEISPLEPRFSRVAGLRGASPWTRPAASTTWTPAVAFKRADAQLHRLPPQVRLHQGAGEHN